VPTDRAADGSDDPGGEAVVVIHQEAIREKVAKAREDEAHHRETDENQ
jgi:hypothetical protein